ncbi:MAG: ATP-binding protein [Anaerolineaceae bacterium]|nr:ATP-binding protein [Anaerolineaceae bacterium]
MKTATFPGRYDSLARISEFVLRAAKQAGLDEKAVYAVQTAVDEACSNIIEHAYGGEGLGEINCSVLNQEDSLAVILRDRGKSFDPSSIPIPNVHSKLFRRKEGGLGLFFIRNYMDEVRFEFSSEKGNQLTMIKYKEKST